MSHHETLEGDQSGTSRVSVDGQTSILVGYRSGAKRRQVETDQAQSAPGYFVRRRYSACPVDSCRSIHSVGQSTMRLMRRPPTIGETKRDGGRHAGCWVWRAGNVISTRLSARGNRHIPRHRAVPWPCYTGSRASLDWEGRLHMAGEGDARSSAEMAVKHVSWSKVCAVAALANTGLAGLAWSATGS